MAKSLRSKWRRKCRAVKRERYGQKELERLKKTLGLVDVKTEVKDADMSEISTVANVVNVEDIKKVEIEDDEMETDTNKRVFSSKTLRDQNGSYPVWLHPRKINKKSRKGKKGKKGKH